MLSLFSHIFLQKCINYSRSSFLDGLVETGPAALGRNRSCCTKCVSVNKSYKLFSHPCSSTFKVSNFPKSIKWNTDKKFDIFTTGFYVFPVKIQPSFSALLPLRCYPSNWVFLCDWFLFRDFSYLQIKGKPKGHDKDVFIPYLKLLFTLFFF